LIHKHTYGNNKPELHTKEYFVGFVTVKDRTGASMTKKNSLPGADDIIGQTGVVKAMIMEAT
jgi:hypothetical protein